jgi:predicted RND superfamily exporter protein
MFHWVGKLVTKNAPGVIIGILIISMIFALAIPEIEFKTNLSKFLPDNDLVRSYDRVNDYFGDEHVVHLIYVEEQNNANDVLTPDALYEQYQIVRACDNKFGVVKVISIVTILDELLSAFQPENYTGFDDLDDDEVDELKGIFFSILNGSFPIVLVNSMVDISPPLTLDELRQMVDIFFDKDFNFNSPEPVARSTIIVVLINGSLQQKVIKQITDDLRTSIDNYNTLQVSHTGGYVISSDLDEVSSESFSLLGVVIIVLIAVILLLTFRRLSYVLIPLITLALAITWTFGTMILLGIEFTVITVAIIPLIIGLGVDYSVYISKRYQEELHKGKDISSAMEKSISSVGIAMFLAVLTTIIAFMSNISSNIVPVQEFGLVCGLGIFYAFILTLTFHTSLRWLIDIKSSKPPEIGKEKELYLINLGTTTASRSVMYYPVLVMIVVIMLSVSAILLGLNVRTEFNDKDFLPNDWESIRTSAELKESFNGSSFSQAYILLESSTLEGGFENGIPTVETLMGIQDMENKITNDRYIVNVNGEPRIESVLSHVNDAIENNASLATDVDNNNDGMPDSDSDVITVFDHLFALSINSESAGSDLEYSLIVRPSIDDVLYRDDTGEYIATVIRVYVNVEDSDDVRKMYDELKDDGKGVYVPGVKKSVTGNVILTVTTMDSLQSSQIVSTIISMIFALIILIIIYRNPILGLIAMTPVMISSIWILGTMYVFGISINVFTVSITALTIGLGIDYAIHIIERYREESKKYQTREAIQRTIHTTGTALFISALTTVFGFIVLTISPIPPIQHFGIITAMTIIYSSILAVVVIPILLMKWSDFKERSEG